MRFASRSRLSHPLPVPFRARGWRQLALAALVLGCTTEKTIVAPGGDGGDGAVPVATVALNGAPTGPVVIGTVVQFHAMARDASGTDLTTRVVNWKSSDTTVARITDLGALRTLAAGRTLVTAYSGQASATAVVDVIPVPVARVVLTPGNVSAYTGQTVQLTATPVDSIGGALTDRAVTWTSSAPGTAKVDAKGLVSAVAVGTATITATSDGKTASVSATVVARPVADWGGAADWTTYQANPSHTGFVPVTADPGAFHELWVSSVVSGTALNPVTAADGMVFVTTRSYWATQRAAVLDAATGAQKWTYDFGSINGVDAPAYGNGRVYIQTSGHEDSYLWAFDASSGAIAFRSAYDNQWSTYFAPVVIGSDVYMAGGYYDGMYKYDATDGTRKWFASLNQYDQWTPAVKNGLVYAYTGSYNPKLTVADAATGAVTYEIPDPHFSWDGWSMNIAPVLGASSDLLATQGGRLISFDLANHSVKWELSSGFTGNVTVGASTLYVFHSNQIEARAESDGALRWVWVPPSGQQLVGTTILTNNLLFVSTGSATYAIDLATHAPVWSYPAGGQLALSKAGTLFVAQANGKLAAVALK